jgi:hypothetical protein
VINSAELWQSCEVTDLCGMCSCSKCDVSDGYYIISYYIMLYYIILYCVVSYHIVYYILYYIVLYYIILCRIILYYIILSYTCNRGSVVRSLLYATRLDVKDKDKAVPLQAWSGPEGSRNLRLPGYTTTAQDGGKLVSLTHRPPLPPRNAPGTHFCYRLSRPQGHSAIGRIMSMEKSNDTIWNRTSDLPICSTVP